MRSSARQSLFAVALPPHHATFRKRLRKRPRLHFLDSGLVRYLLGIERPDVLARHPLRDAVFESFVAAELLKGDAHARREPCLSFWRDATGHEVDVLLDLGTALLPVGVKAGETVAPDALYGLACWTALGGEPRPRPVGSMAADIPTLAGRRREARWGRRPPADAVPLRGAVGRRCREGCASGPTASARRLPAGGSDGRASLGPVRPPSPERLEAALRDLAERLAAWGAERIVVFGSVARGDYSAGSDIDLLIVKETGERFTRRIEEALEECDAADPPLPVEPLVYTRAELERMTAAGNPLIRRALREGRVIHDSAERT